MKHALSSDPDVRREELRMRSAQLREQIAIRAQVFRPVLETTDRVRDGLLATQRFEHRIEGSRSLALLLGAALAGAFLVRPRVGVRLGLRAWSAYQLFRRLRPVVNTALRYVR